ncbi:MAG: type II toxin-antitoxin system VapC family toxin [Thermodesulfobacteriota bacterium]|nr:type II toxin-antitoxin system VapC family toxin [Thermodesulfobacteriota bacterium]
MIYFFDTSALIKRYVEEKGSNIVDNLMESADEIFISAITRIESISTARRLLEERSLSKSDFNVFKDNLASDFPFFTVVDFSEYIEKKAIELIEKFQIKTLDAIQLACCLTAKEDIDHLVTSDIKLAKTASDVGIDTINPME